MPLHKKPKRKINYRYFNRKCDRNGLNKLGNIFFLNPYRSNIYSLIYIYFDKFVFSVFIYFFNDS